MLNVLAQLTDIFLSSYFFLLTGLPEKDYDEVDDIAPQAGSSGNEDMESGQGSSQTNHPIGKFIISVLCVWKNIYL